MSEAVTRDWFDAWADEYDDIIPRVPEYQMLVNNIVEYAGVKDGDVVLDIGCGTGFLSLKFVDAAKCKLTAIDLSGEMLAVFRDKLNRLRNEGYDFMNRIELRPGNAVNLPFRDEAFDIVASSAVMHHVTPEEKSKALKEIYRVLKPGGKFLLGELNVDTSGDHNDIKRLERLMASFTKLLILLVSACGAGVLDRMFDNTKKHLLNDGEYAIEIAMWADMCKDVGFDVIRREVLPSGIWGVLVAKRT
ncbi:MAG: class I SAM-dependent methyltransferase [Candidatus Syntropharchaeales archaeon]|nr:class I SAM-dependent methyltransferase [Candidatus Syntrophoarchaeum sp.]